MPNLRGALEIFEMEAQGLSRAPVASPIRTPTPGTNSSPTAPHIRPSGGPVRAPGNAVRAKKDKKKEKVEDSSSESE